jgi:sigma-B regulation protein RsbU (phosphoserine phosphatase)
MRFGSFHSVAVKFTLLALLGTGTILCIVLAYTYWASAKMMVREAESAAQNLVGSFANNMSQKLRAVVEVTESLASFLEQSPRLPKEDLLSLIRRQVHRVPDVFGSTAAFEPNAFDKDIGEFAPYYYKTRDGLRYVQLGEGPYDYFLKDWYRKPKELEVPVWSKPYFDEGGGDVIMATYSCPFFELDKDGKRTKFRGVVTADISVGWLTKELSELKVLKGGYSFLISAEGTFLVHPNHRFVMKESLFSLAEKDGNTELSDIGRAILTRKSGILDIGKALSDQSAYLAFSRLPTNGWSLGVVYPKRSLFSGVISLLKTNVALAATGLMLLLVVSLAVARTVTRPLRHMVRATEQVALGDLDIDLSLIRSKDEVGRLAEAFTHMSMDLKKYIRDLTEATAAKERIESELAVASRIQRSVVPSVFSDCPESDGFDIYAVMNPAREIGGDFYEFFRVDEDNLCFAVGDVSDKGVPAAFFMATTVFLIRSLAREGARPDQILTRINRELAEGNDSCMFVTVFCGELNLKTGKLFYSNGGHEPPCLLTPQQTIATLAGTNGPAIGLADDLVYTGEIIDFPKGSTLFAYTDGLTEAQDQNRELFSEERLRDELLRLKTRNVKQIVEGMMIALTSFAQGAPREDDITMMALRFNGRDSNLD